MQGRSVPHPVGMEGEPHRSSQDGERYDSAQDNLARFVVFFGPYILWGTLGALAGMIVLFST